MGFAKKQSSGCLLRFEQLEDRRLLAATVELPHLGDPDGSCSVMEVVCCFATPVSADSGASVTVDSFFDDPESPTENILDRIFELHSNPSAKHTIYLDFTGFTTVNTLWNAQYSSQIVTPAFSLDDDPGFSEIELAAIHWIWACVAEDFSPFHVNVTTQEPEPGDLIKSGSSDDRWGIRVVIGGASDWYGQSAGGVAYTGTFTDATDTPCFVFSEEFLVNGVTMGNLTNIASAISHEVGHTLGLSHDGHQSGVEYYNGHTVPGTDPPITWGSIMGAGYDKSIVQWSKGDYSGANNTENDLLIITMQNGFGYRADDHANSILNATELKASGIPIEIGGIIERNTDEDCFVFRTTGGTAEFLVQPTRYNGNLDAKLELLDSKGNVIAVSTETAENPFAAAISIPLSSGIYLIRISGCGKGNSLTGYSDYGSLGQYTLIASGSYSEDFPAPRIETFDFPAESQVEKWTLRQSGTEIIIVDDRGNIVFQQAIDNMDSLTLNGGNSGAIVLCIDLSNGTPDLSGGILFQGAPDGVNCLEILGTERDDVFLLESSQGTLNGLTVSWTHLNRIHVDTLDGSDRVEIHSVDDDGSLLFRDEKLTFCATTVETVEVVHAEDMLVRLAGMNGSAKIADTPANDTFVITGDSVTLQGDRQTLQAVGFEIVELVAFSGGKDHARIWADDGATIVLSDQSAEYRYQGRFYRVWYAETVTAINAPGNDVNLIHYGSRGTDIWEQSEEMIFAGNTIGSYHHWLIGFSQRDDENVEPPEAEPTWIPVQDRCFDTALMHFLAEESDFRKKRRSSQTDDFSINFEYQTLLDLLFR